MTTNGFRSRFTQDWVWILLLFIASRVLLHLIGLAGFASTLDHPFQATDLVFYAQRPDLVWGIWDAIWYERIAMEGYAGPRSVERGFSAWGFMPLYPLVTGAVTRLLGGTDAHAYFLVASVLSSAFSYAALVSMYRFYKVRCVHPNRFVGYFLCGCGTFYLSIPYTEGLFVLLIAGVFHATDRRRYLPAALLCGLALATRVQGAALVAIPFIDYWLKERPRLAEGMLTSLAIGVLHLLPLGIFTIGVMRLTGDPFAWIHAQSAWNNSDPYPLKAIVGLTDTSRGIGPYLHAGVWAMYLTILARNYRALGLANVTFCLGVFLISTSTEVFYGANRYVLALLPILAVLTAERAWVRRTFLAVNIILLPLYVMGFVTWRYSAI